MGSGPRRSAAALTLALLTAVAPPAWAQQPEEEDASKVVEAPAPNTVTAYGAAADHGPSSSMGLAEPLVAMAPTPTGGGYWLAASDGGVFAFGDAAFSGSAGAIDLNRPVVAMAATPSGDGYWLVASDGGVFTFGSASFHGSMGGVALNEPIVGMAATPTGDGYWLVASDGGVFAFGDAEFHGSMGGVELSRAVVGMAATPEAGYWLAAADGGVFTFGDARFHGSMGGKPTDRPVVAVAASPGGDGYWLAAEDGQVYAFGVIELGSAAEADAEGAEAETVAVAAHPGGDGYWLAHGALPVVEVEERGPGVAALQRRLRDLGYWVGPVDGVFGELLEQAVFAFQKYEGLTVDGVVTRATRAALSRASRPAPRSAGGDRIEVDKARQLLFVVRGGRAEWVFNTSTGTEEPYTFEGQTYLADTPEGRWTVYREIDGVRVSNLGRLVRPKYFHEDGIAIHGYAFVPPYPVSHGCVRVTLPAIDFIWGNGLAPIGAEVWVYGTTPEV
ncbi:MAG TPA: L,D-transpeptidase family protein [Acidimicrobiales bacterium]|nr:L,D-transpeptidase family protein [Acidimicrobiales bacterium]